MLVYALALPAIGASWLGFEVGRSMVKQARFHRSAFPPRDGKEWERRYFGSFY
jgi:hypothetical protein